MEVTHPTLKPRARPLRARGFTLIEVMIVVVIVSILATISYPSYTENVAKGRRAEAAAVMVEAAAWLERQAGDSGSYAEMVSETTLAGQATMAPVNQTALINAGFSRSPKSGDTVRYAITFRSGPDVSSYVLQAEPTVADRRCGTLTLDQHGNRGAILSGAPLSASDASRCWSQ